MANQVRKPKPYKTPIEGKFVVGHHGMIYGQDVGGIYALDFNAALRRRKKIKVRSSAVPTLYKLVEVDGKGAEV